MSTDILIQALKEAFQRAVQAAVDSHMEPLWQQTANVNSQLSTEIDALKQRVAALELRIPVEGMTETRVLKLIDSKIEEALDEHANTYDHDRYDSVCDDFENNNDLENAVRDALRNASFSVEVSL